MIYPTERLRLASMILQDLTRVADQTDAWSEQDQRDLTAFSLQHAGRLYPEDERTLPSPVGISECVKTALVPLEKSDA